MPLFKKETYISLHAGKYHYVNEVRRTRHICFVKYHNDIHQTVHCMILAFYKMMINW